MGRHYNDGSFLPAFTLGVVSCFVWFGLVGNDLSQTSTPLVKGGNIMGTEVHHEEAFIFCWNDHSALLGSNGKCVVNTNTNDANSHPKEQ